VVSADGALARLDAASGRETWRIKAGSDITSSAGSDGSVVAVGAEFLGIAEAGMRRMHV